MRLIVDDKNVLYAHQVRHDALDHLAFGFKRLRFLACTALKQLAPPLEISMRSRILKA